MLASRRCDQLSLCNGAVLSGADDISVVASVHIPARSFDRARNVACSGWT
jgi:hypothetical protein